MPRQPARKGKKVQKVQKADKADKADKAVLLAQLELARAERARAEQKIQRLEKKLLGSVGAMESETSDPSESDAETSDASDASDASQVDLGEMLFDRLLEGLADGFPASIRTSAQEVIRDGPQEDEQSRKGCNWIGGIRLAWTCPPTVREVKRHVQEHFPKPIKAGDSLSEIDGKKVEGLSRRDILDLLRKFKGSIGFHRGKSDKAIRESAKDALKKGPQEDAEYDEGCNWIWGFLLAWTSPPVVRDVKPEVQEHFPNPINPGDVLHQIDGKRVSNLKRAEVLKLLQNYKGSIGFRSSKGGDFNKSAHDALRNGPQEDKECEGGCNWIGGILLAWTSPPVVRDVKPEVQNHFPRPISVGDVLHSIDGKKVHDLSREEILKLLRTQNGLCFRTCADMDDKVCKSAEDALRSGPQKDNKCEEGCNWIGGILLAWTSPPVVRDVKPEVQKHFPRPVSPGDLLREIDGKPVLNLGRSEVLKLFQNFKGSLGFRASANGMDDDVRSSAQEALDNGPEEDEHSQHGCNWIGGILLAWTSPPVVRDVKPEVQKHFRHPLSPGDVLHSVGGQEVMHMSRDEILRSLTNFDGGLGFRAKKAGEISLADLLRRLGDLWHQTSPTSSVLACECGTYTYKCLSQFLIAKDLPAANVQFRLALARPRDQKAGC